MIANSCIKIETNKFPILDGEKEEVVNENMYGKALCIYLQEKLPGFGVDVPSFINEDWGWWLDTKIGGFSMGLCIYSDPDATEDPESYAIMPSIHSEKVWSWKKFRKVDVSAKVLEVIDKTIHLFEADNEIDKVSRHSDFPY